MTWWYCSDWSTHDLFVKVMCYYFVKAIVFRADFMKLLGTERTYLCDTEVTSKFFYLFNEKDLSYLLIELYLCVYSRRTSVIKSYLGY
jgi:hypothetical protein